jgi:hypothetical protein
VGYSFLSREALTRPRGGIMTAISLENPAKTLERSTRPPLRPKGPEGWAARLVTHDPDEGWPVLLRRAWGGLGLSAI